MPIFTKYIQNEEHYSEVISRIMSVRNNLWIGTADIKDVYVKQDGDAIPLLGQLATLLKRGVGVRLIHAKEPGPNFREDFDRFPILVTDLERVMCPRVHFKMMIFDLETAYIGSANHEKGTDYPNHSPFFKVDEDVLWTGTGAYVQFAKDYLDA